MTKVSEDDERQQCPCCDQNGNDPFTGKPCNNCGGFDGGLDE